MSENKKNCWKKITFTKAKQQQNILQRTPTEHSFHCHCCKDLSSHVECNEQIKGLVLCWQSNLPNCNMVGVFSYLSLSDLI